MKKQSNRPLTKKDIENIVGNVFDRKIGNYQDSVLSAVDDKFTLIQKGQSKLLVEENTRFTELDKRLDKLVTTLDSFLKRMTDHEDEFAILKAEINQIKHVLKSNFGIEISLQSPNSSHK